MDNLKSKNEGILKIGDKELPCAVLDDNTRVITASAVFHAFDRPRKGKSSEDYRVDLMPSFINANNLQPFVSKELIEWTNLIKYTDKSGRIRTGYNAYIIRELCKVYIDARKANALLKSQIRFAEIAENILYALSSVGIIAMIDEATGYQYEREKDELQKIYALYLSEKLLPWQKKFPNDFYKELFRLNGWEYTVHGINKRPSIIGKWTRTLIYDQLPKGIIDELEKRTPKSKSGNYTARFHQSLSEDIGHPALDNQLTQVLTIFRLSDNMAQMWAQFNKLKQRQQGQLFLPFEFDDDGYTIEPKQEKELKKQEHKYEIDPFLSQALNYNPNKDKEQEPTD